MALIHDHFFILTEPGAPLSEHLAKLGLIEGSGNRHPGQGTSNRRFFLANSTLELLYLSDVDEAVNGPAARLQFERRWQDPLASPFGLVVSNTGKSARDPFPGWRYCPDYFDADQCFLVGSNSPELAEPLCICMPEEFPPAAPLPIANPGWHLSALRVHLPLDEPSAVLKTFAACRPVSLVTGQPHHLELEFNQCSAGGYCDLRPEYPLSLAW